MITEHEQDKAVTNLYGAVRNIMDAVYLDKNGNVRGTKRTWGYVAKVHTDPDDELYNTVDVQEYDDYEDDIKDFVKYDKTLRVNHLACYHEGVYVTALQNNIKGMMIMPSLYSDVMITCDEITMREYVVLCSHVDVIQMRSHTTAMIGVVETEPFKEVEDNSSDEGIDMPDLKETGNAATSSYTKSKIIHQVNTPKGSVSISMEADGTIVINASKVKINGGTLMTDGDVTADACGPHCAIDKCPFTGMIHRGSSVTNT